MNIDGWTGRWAPVMEHTHYENPDHVFDPVETRVRANGLSLWMEMDIRLPGGIDCTWRYEGAMDGKMRPLYFVHNGELLTHIAFYLLDQNFGGDTNRRVDGTQNGCEYWRLDGDLFSVWGMQHVLDKGQYPYREVWRRIA